MALQRVAGLSLLWLLAVSMTVVGMASWWRADLTWLPALGVAFLVGLVGDLVRRKRK